LYTFFLWRNCGEIVDTSLVETILPTTSHSPLLSAKKMNRV